MKQHILDLAGVSMFVLIFGLGGCSNGPKDVVGTGSGTETAFIQGTLVGSGQTKKADQTVYLYSTNFIPIPDWDKIDSIQGFHYSAVTDSDGFFRFDSVAEGQYNLVATDTAAGQGIYIPGMDKKGDTAIELGQMIMGKNGAVSGTAPDHDWVFIRGTGFFSPGQGTSPDFRLANLPEGVYTICVYWLPFVCPPDRPPGWGCTYPGKIKSVPDIQVSQDSTIVIDTVKYN